MCVCAAAFVPPDVEDPPSPVEMDEEEMEWHRWLGDLMNPTGTDNHDRLTLKNSL